MALAIDAPPSTAFFQNASVLLVGETTKLTAEFSPATVSGRSRLLGVARLNVVKEEPAPPPTGKDAAPDEKDKPALITYKIGVPATAIPGDTVQLSLEADGTQLSHSQLRILSPLTLSFEDAVAVRVAANSSVPLSRQRFP